MKITIIAGVMAASILLVGCGKKNSSPDSPASPTNAQPDVASSSITQAAMTAQEIQQPGDSELREKVTGVWNGNKKILGSTIEYTFTFAPNGNYAKQSVISHGKEKKNSTAFGTWQVKDGVLITTVTKIDPMPQGAIGGDLAKGLANGMVDSHKIISVNEHELAIEIDVYTITGNGGHSKTKGTMTWTR
jgi:major membrane immunogen (membrane-anchored lipoprotein)